MKLHYYRDRNKQIRWKLVGRNGKIVDAATEGFSTVGKAAKNFALIREGKITAIINDIKPLRAKAGKPTPTL